MNVLLGDEVLAQDDFYTDESTSSDDFLADEEEAADLNLSADVDGFGIENDDEDSSY